jgi:hypothetical protein
MQGLDTSDVLYENREMSLRLVADRKSVCRHREIEDHSVVVLVCDGWIKRSEEAR